MIKMPKKIFSASILRRKKKKKEIKAIFDQNATMQNRYRE